MAPRCRAYACSSRTPATWGSSLAPSAACSLTSRGCCARPGAAHRAAASGWRVRGWRSRRRPGAGTSPRRHWRCGHYRRRRRRRARRRLAGGRFLAHRLALTGIAIACARRAEPRFDGRRRTGVRAGWSGDGAVGQHTAAAPRPRVQSQRITNTGTWLRASTSAVWLPSSTRLMPRRPCEVITIRSQ